MVDGNLSTVWQTDDYYGGNLDGKPGVGIYVSGADSAVTARTMVVYTSTTGFSAKIEATNQTPDPYHFTGWTPVGSATDVGAQQHFHPGHRRGKELSLLPAVDHLAADQQQLHLG